MGLLFSHCPSIRRPSRNVHLLSCESTRTQSQKKWQHATGWNLEITAIKSNYTHIVAFAVRRKEDGSSIEKEGPFTGYKEKTANGK